MAISSALPLNDYIPEPSFELNIENPGDSNRAERG
jgi:hypothetical protein